MSHQACLLTIFLTCCFGASESQSFPTDRSEQQAALSFVTDHHLLIDSVLNGMFGLASHVAVSIALPEAAHYSRLKNAFETSALQVFYIELGKEYANFSIGKLQMKPSFCEELERHPMARLYKEQFRYTSTDEHKVREERVDRMSKLRWQLTYLGLFIKIMEQQFGEKLNEDNIALFAGAYNLGINVSPEKIMTWNLVPNFPSGKRRSTDQPYALIAVQYFHLLQTPTVRNETIGN